jgi:hypothetical protein
MQSLLRVRFQPFLKTNRANEGNYNNTCLNLIFQRLWRCSIFITTVLWDLTLYGLPHNSSASLNNRLRFVLLNMRNKSRETTWKNGNWVHKFWSVGRFLSSRQTLRETRYEQGYGANRWGYVLKANGGGGGPFTRNALPFTCTIIF